MTKVSLLASLLLATLGFPSLPVRVPYAEDYSKGTEELRAAAQVPKASSGRKDAKARELRWDPPEVDAPILSLATTPPCSLPDVLNLAGQRAAQLIGHLQNFDAQEQVH